MTYEFAAVCKKHHCLLHHEKTPMSSDNGVLWEVDLSFAYCPGYDTMVGQSTSDEEAQAEACDNEWVVVSLSEGS